jgi:hypothetical protein
MQKTKTALTMFSALLISGLAVQSAAASEHHARFHRATNGPMTIVDEDPRALPNAYRSDRAGQGGHEWDPWGHWGSYYGPTVHASP